MIEPVTASLVFVGSAIVSGVLGNRSDAGFKARWDKFRDNLEEHRPYANHELARAAYRAYLQATLQSCAALLESNHLKVEAWFKLGTLPEKMGVALRSLLSKAPAGVFTEANKQWLEAVSRDHIGKLKLLDKEKLDPPAAYEHEEFAALLKEIELLMQPEETKDREHAIHLALATRVLSDLESQFGEAPEKFTVLVNERWFEFLCAGFQYYTKHRQEIANAFESRLLAKLVARSEWQHQLTDFGGESLKRIEGAQTWLRQEQREGFERIDSLVSLFLPLISFAVDEATRSETLTMLIRAESDRVIDEVSGSVEAVGDSVVERVAEEFQKRLPPHFPTSNASEPLIHTLPTPLGIEGRAEECATILRVMSESNQHVLAFAAPGGFGKTALLAKVVREISADGKTLLERVTLQNGETIETRTSTLLHIDCRNDVKLSALFANAGRLVGQEQVFQDIYNSDASLSNKLQDVFSRLSTNEQKRDWFVFDNFDPLLNDKGEISDAGLRDFFSAFFVGGHSVYALIAARDMPKFSPRAKVLELESVGASLFDGLPLDDCCTFLKRNGAARGLNGTAEEIDTVLKEFAQRVHRVPLALVWAIGYLHDTKFTLKQVLKRRQIFADFDREQAKNAERYENKGLKRLHYEQLKMQTTESLLVLRLLAFFKRAVPKGALAHLLNEIELNRTLARLERNKLITRKESEDAHTQYLNAPLEISLYGLHPVMCENQFFDTLPGKKALYDAAANECWNRAALAYDLSHFAYAVELFDCAEKLYEHLTKGGKRPGLLHQYAAMLTNKGATLEKLIRLHEAMEEYDKAVAILEPLVKKEHGLLAYGLAFLYLNKGNALQKLTRLHEAVAEYRNAIALLERLVNERLASKEQLAEFVEGLALAYLNAGTALYGLNRLPEAIGEQTRAINILEGLINDEPRMSPVFRLATAYVNRSAALRRLEKLLEALADDNKAIAILERLVNNEENEHLANSLAAAYVQKASALSDLGRHREGIEECNKAIDIFEHMVKEEQQGHLANDLAAAYVNKGTVLQGLNNLREALAEYDKAIVMLERLVNEGWQGNLADNLFTAYMNKGVLLSRLTKFPDAIAEYDKAIALRSVNMGQDAHLANDLARVYMNKAKALERQQDWVRALSCYEESLQAWTHCIKQLNMSWMMPQLLHTLRYRLAILLNLQHWALAARDVMQFHSLYEPYVSDAIDDGLKTAAGEEFTQMIDSLRALSAEQRELLYFELGGKGEDVRSLVSESVR